MSPLYWSLINASFTPMRFSGLRIAHKPIYSKRTVRPHPTTAMFMILHCWNATGVLNEELFFLLCVVWVSTAIIVTTIRSWAQDLHTFISANDGRDWVNEVPWTCACSVYTECEKELETFICAATSTRRTSTTPISFLSICSITCPSNAFKCASCSPRWLLFPHDFLMA